MIKFVARTLPIKNADSFENKMKAEAANRVIVDIAHQLTIKYGKNECPFNASHKGRENKVVISTDMDMNHDFNLTDFCCQEFSDTIRVEGSHD